MLLAIYLYGGLCISMTKYPNREALRKAHDIYRDAMREFICQSLENRVQDETVEDLIMRALNREQHSPIDIKGISRIFRNPECWDDFFSHKFGYDQRLGRNGYDIRGVTSVIVMGRNKVSHPGSRDLDPDYTNTHLFLITEVLGEIGKTQAKYEVQDIWDDLCSDEPEEHPVEVENTDLNQRLEEMSAQLEMVKTEKTEYEDKLRRLEAEKVEYEELLDAVEKEKIEIETQLGTAPTRLNEMKAENTGLKKQLLEIDNRLKAVELESDEHIKTLTEQLADSEERFKNSQKHLKTTNAVKTKLEQRLETTSTRLENVEGELDDCKKDLARNLKQLKVMETENTKLKKRLPPEPMPSNNMPDSITFHGTTFTKHLEEYYAEEDEITQTFWHYWHSQGPEGKKEMRDAGWSVEQVNGDWEVVVSPEDLQAWIVHEVTELSSLLNSWQDEETSKQSTRLSAALRQFTQLSATLRQSIPLSSEKTSLPTGEEMEQPALEFLSDRREHRRVEIIDHLSEHFSLTGDQRSYLSKTGKAEKHLMKEGLIERTRDGYYRITAHGFRYQNDLDDAPF